MFQQEGLTIIIAGASGDLAKRKTYPSLFRLYESNCLPENTVIWGYARSEKTHELFRSQLKTHLISLQVTDDGEYAIVIDEFLSTCFYHYGNSYGDLKAYRWMEEQIQVKELRTVTYRSSKDNARNNGRDMFRKNNRLFYLAVPPNVFAETVLAVKKVLMAQNGWNRVIVEKPFGRDLESCGQLSNILLGTLKEDQIFRIDHYLGKIAVQNLLTMRFGNRWLKWLWNRNAISSVLIEFKEKIGTDGRGGYFDQYGIIRDVIQNHLLQVLTLVTMEPPAQLDGTTAGDCIRDCKVDVLRSIPPIKVGDVILGQYEGYANDPSILNKNTNTATYAALCCYVNTPRWKGVPFMITAGKALDEAKVEINIQFKDTSTIDGDLFLNSTGSCPKNDLVIQLQPIPSIAMKTNIMSPVFESSSIQRQLELNYNTLFDMKRNPEAYSRLIFDALRGRNESFVRDDELLRSWEIFTPMLNYVEATHMSPYLYARGTSGPKEAFQFIERIRCSKSLKLKQVDDIQAPTSAL